MFTFGKNSLDKLATVDERLQLLANEVLKASKIDIGISSGIRSDEEQHQIFLSGASQCDGINQRSKHQDGLAFDFVCYINNQITFEKKYYYYIVGLMQVIATIKYRYNLRCLVEF
jgi:peptidoglycan L-alanyl-D-glutamate endopeptidase CwlK